MSIISAWVCFTGETELKFLSFLKKGFKHCCVLIEYSDTWLILDPLSTYTDIEIIPKEKVQNLPLWLSSHDYFVMKAPLNRENIKPHTIGVYSCVSFVKKILGIKSLRLQTPWQLARYLYAHKTKGEKMGKIIPKPKAPKVVVQPVDPVKEVEKEKDQEELERERIQRSNLLSQTVKTSLRGALSETNEMLPPRKTLLGE